MEEPIAPAEVHSSLARVMPIETERCSLVLAEDQGRSVFEEKGSLVAVLRLIIWDLTEGTRSIRDIKEQWVVMVREKDRDRRSRLDDYLLGWVAAVRRVFERAPERVEVLMPHDLVAAPILGLKKLRGAEAFESAALAKSRLGKWLD